MLSRIRDFLGGRAAPNRTRSVQWIVARSPAALAALAILQFVGENRRTHIPPDDAYIFYRYAHNLVDGHGLVFNVGERVEGFTSLIWTLLVAGGVALGLDAVSVGHWLGVASGSLLLWSTYLYAAHELAGAERLVAAVAPWLLLLSKPFAIWATSGLETPLFAAAAVAALLAEARGRTGLALLVSALGVLIRPEGVLLGVIVLGLSFYRGRLSSRRRWLLLASYAAFLLTLTLFRLSYFGAPLPNTFYAKVGGTTFWWSRYYIAVFLLQTLLPTLWPSAYCLKLRYFTGGFCWIAAIFAFVVVVGGDAFSHSRFFVPMLPVSCALVVRGALSAHRRGSRAAYFAVWSVAVSGLWFALGMLVGAAALIAAALLSCFGSRGSRTRRVLVGVVSALLLAGSLSVVGDWKLPFRDTGTEEDSAAVKAMSITSRASDRREVRRLWRSMGFGARLIAERLNARPPHDKLVAAVGIGALGYHARQARILDIVGLTDPVVARKSTAGPDGVIVPGHQRSNSRHVLSKKPDYILIPEQNQPIPFTIPAVTDLWKDPEFQRYYVWEPDIGGYRREDSTDASGQSR